MCFVCHAAMHVHVGLSSSKCARVHQYVRACVSVYKSVCSLQHTDIIKQLAQSFQPQQGQIIQSALSSNTVWIYY